MPNAYVLPPPPSVPRAGKKDNNIFSPKNQQAQTLKGSYKNSLAFAPSAANASLERTNEHELSSAQYLNDTTRFKPSSRSPAGAMHAYSPSGHDSSTKKGNLIHNSQASLEYAGFDGMVDRQSTFQNGKELQRHATQAATPHMDGQLKRLESDGKSKLAKSGLGVLGG